MPIIRLNGSSYINDMELKERYKVYNDSCWISLLSLVGNPDGVIVTVDEPVSPLLTMDLEKRLKTALEEDPADFLVVDMCYTAGHRLCVWKDQVFPIKIPVSHHINLFHLVLMLRIKTAFFEFWIFRKHLVFPHTQAVSHALHISFTSTTSSSTNSYCSSNIARSHLVS